MHFRSAGEPDAAAQVVDRAIPSIVRYGEFERALPLLDGTAGPADRVGALVLRSRIEFTRGNWKRAIALAEAAAAAPGNPLLGTALLNLSALEGVAGFPDGAITRAASALDTQLSEHERRVARASLLLQGAQREGNLAEVADALKQLAMEQELAGLKRYAAISRLNLASVLIWLGDPRGAIDEAVRAEVGLGASPADVEQVAAMSARATALAQLRRHDEAALVMRHAQSVRSLLGRQEAALEVARTECDYGSIDRATGAMHNVDRETLPAGYRGLWDLVSGMLALRSGAIGSAVAACESTHAGELQDAAGALRAQLLRARTALAHDDPNAGANIEELARIAVAQESRPGQLIANILAAAAGTSQVTTEATALGPEDRHVLSVVAEDVSRLLFRLSPDALEVVNDEASARPERWASALRLVVSHPGSSRQQAATLLAAIGGERDASFLREHAVTAKVLRPAAAAITRRLAPMVFIADLGAVRIEIAGSTTERTTRRKVLGLLCFLASRTGQAATKDEALDALWPDVNPDTGSNSLHQAIYYLRRVFDPDFREGLSAPYVEFDGDVISLNPELVDCASKRCWRLLNGSSPLDLGATNELLHRYVGRYALDFAYEDWASGYRETLHAAVLGRTEASMGVALGRGDFDWAVNAGQRALFVDPTADGIELQLLRTYKAAGRLAAASEQYAHYSTALRNDLGVDPPPFDAI